MKRVYNAAMVAHLWVHQSQASAYTASRNFSFGLRDDRETIYSYSTPIGRMVKDKNGEPVVLFTSRHYSVTTSAQMTDLRRALHGLNKTEFSVQDCTTGEYSHDNLAQLVSEYRDHVATEMRRVKWYRDIAATPVNDNYGIADKAMIATMYAWHFNLRGPVLDVAGDVRRIHNRRVCLTLSPKAVARAAASEERRAAAQAKRDAANVERERIARLDSVEQLNLWRAGQCSTHTLHYLARRDGNGSAYLRIVGDGLETSLGAEVPLAHATRAYAHFQKVRAALSTQIGDSWTRDESADLPCTRVGHFTIDKVSALGVNIDCHFCSWSELDRVLGSMQS
jgi:hypothetical protein